MPQLVPIDEGVVPEGYEPVRVGHPKFGELYLHCGWVVRACGDHTKSDIPVLIVRRKHVWPKWLKEGTWLFRFNDYVYASQIQPSRTKGAWLGCNDGIRIDHILDIDLPDLTEPVQVKHGEGK